MDISALSLLLAGTVVLLAALAAAIVAKRVWRDAGERRIARRRRQMMTALTRGGAAAGARVGAAARSGGAALLDACAEVDRAWDRLTPGEREALGYAVRRNGAARLLERGCRSPALVPRARATIGLGHLRLPEAVPHLERRLSDRDAHVRLVAAGSLRRIATREAAEALIDGLSAAVLPEQRLVEALGGAWAAGALLAAFADPERAAIRAAVAEALGLSRARAAVGAFAEAMPAAGPELRVRMVRALGRIGGRRAGTVVAAAMDDPDWHVRAQAARSLARMRDRRAAALLERGLHDRSWWVRANCGAGLRRLGPAGTVALRRALRSPDRFARDRAREALDLEAAGRRAA